MPQSIEVEGELEWEAERVLHYGKKCNLSTLQYLIKYFNYGISDTILLDEHDLHNSPNIFKA